MRLRLAVLLALASPSPCPPPRRPRRSSTATRRRQAEGRAERPGARQLQRARASAGTCSPGARSTRSTRPRAASRSSSSSTTPAATARTSATSGRRSRTPAARTTAPTCSGSSPAARRPTARTGRSSRGSGCCPNYGLTATPKQSVWELRLSHWSGALPELTVNLNWAYRKYHHIFGSFTYLGRPVHGFKSTSRRQPARHLRPQPLPRHVRLRLRHGLDAREQLPDAQGHGQVLLRLLPPRRPAGGRGHASTARRSSAPASLPDIYWEAEALGAYDQAFDLQMHDDAEGSSSPATRSAGPSDLAARATTIARRVERRAS